MPEDVNVLPKFPLPIWQRGCYSLDAWADKFKGEEWQKN
jgi:hypothetical protein